MGRHAKTVLTATGLDRRRSGYYSTPSFISAYIAKRLLEINPHACSVLDPCIGKGEMAAPFLSRGLKVTGFDVIKFPLDSRVDFTPIDFLTFYRDRVSGSDLFEAKPLPYDFVIANPPYNCHELEYIRENKAWLAVAFGDIGVHNMYSMFIAAILRATKPGAVIGLIASDSFLTAKAHSALRQEILHNCVIHDMLLCPMDLFRDQGADVRTVLLVLEKSTSKPDFVRTLNRCPHTSAFKAKLLNSEFEFVSHKAIVISGDCDHSELVIGVPQQIRELFDGPRLGHRFRCVTGISTGDDRRFLSPIKKTGFTVPFYKNPASRRFFATPDAYLIDDFLHKSEQVANFMVRNKGVLFKRGISCSSMGAEFGACYLPANSTFGVNANIIPEAENDIWWLLAYLNSDLATYCVRSILNRSNMVTAGYVSRVPLVPLSTTATEQLGRIARSAFESAQAGRAVAAFRDAINELLARSLNLTPDVRETLSHFSKNVKRIV
jgi:methylase of polypeptide subunit release factors